MARLTIDDIIDVLCHYDLTHTRMPHNYLAEMDDDIPILFGLAMDDRKEILIDKEAPLESMRETVLHEIYHCYHYLRGDIDGKSYDQAEKIVDRETNAHLKYLKSLKRNK